MLYHSDDYQSLKATLNGAPLSDIVWADDSLGEAEIFCHDREGQRIPDSDSVYRYQTIRVKGTVTVEAQKAEPTATGATGGMPEAWWQAAQALGICLQTQYWDLFDDYSKILVHRHNLVPVQLSESGRVLCTSDCPGTCCYLERYEEETEQCG